MTPAHLTRCLLLLPILLAPTWLLAGSAPVETVDLGDRITMNNGIVGITLLKRTGNLVSIRYRVDGNDIELGDGNKAMYFDANCRPDVAPRAPPTVRGKAGYIAARSGTASVVSNAHDRGEIALSSSPAPDFPFQTELHFILLPDQPGFYVYVLYEHGPHMAAASLAQSRTVIRGVPGTRLFTNYIVDDQRQGPYPTAKVVQTVQDATDRLADGTIYTKYNNSAFISDDLVHGMAGPKLGIWMIMPGREYVNGGPLRQELTVHSDNVLLWMFQGEHFGAPDIHLEDNEQWSHFYGPAFVYVNHGKSPAALWKDAKDRARAEEAKWPCDFVDNPEYPLARGRVSGKLRLTDGHSVEGAWVVLAPKGDDDYFLSSKGYIFWSRAGSDGHFELTNVRPGTYTLFATGADQFESFKHPNLEVTAGAPIDLGTLDWEPVMHGKRLWQIGIADHSTAEFKNGDDVRHYDNFSRYAKSFPNDVTFVIGKSVEKNDWNFSQWSCYSAKPYWTIQFDEPNDFAGEATLTLGICSSERGGLQVKINGIGLPGIGLQKSGAAGYRSGGQDSMYQLFYLRFDASLIRHGRNEITLGLEHPIPLAAGESLRPGRLTDVMYDAIRLEVEPKLSPN